MFGRTKFLLVPSIYGNTQSWCSLAESRACRVVHLDWIFLGCSSLHQDSQVLSGQYACQSYMSKDHRHRASSLCHYHRCQLDVEHGNVRVEGSLVAGDICFLGQSYRKFWDSCLSWSHQLRRKSSFWLWLHCRSQQQEPRLILDFRTQEDPSLYQRFYLFFPWLISNEHSVQMKHQVVYKNQVYFMQIWEIRDMLPLTDLSLPTTIDS